MEKTIQTVEKISLRASLLGLEAGDELKVPFGVRAYSYVRHIASIVGMEKNRSYKVHADKEASAYRVSRVS